MSEQTKPSRKILKRLSSEERLAAEKQALMNSVSNRDPRYHEEAIRREKEFVISK